MADSLKNAISFERVETAPCSYKVDFKLPADAVDKVFADALKKAGKHALIPGFRKGKAPAALVRARYGEYIAEDVEKQIQNVAFEKLSEDPSADIVSFGAMNAEKHPEAGADYAFSLEVEFAPEIKVPEYKGAALEVPAGESVEDILKKRLEHMKNLYSDYLEIEEPAKEGDLLKVSYESDFVLPEDASASLRRSVKADESWIWLNQPEQFPGVIAALTGAVKGGEYTFTAEFPADWRESGLQGKSVSYRVKVHEAQRKVPVSDEAKLAEKLGLENVGKMHEELKKAAEREAEAARKEALRTKALEYLLEKTEAFPLPKGVLASTTEREFSRIAERLVRKEEDVEKFKAEKEKHLEEAKRLAEEYLRKFFILRRIARDEKVEVSRAELDEQIHAMSHYMGYKEADVRKMLERNGGMAEIQADILMSKTLDAVAAAANAAS